MVKIYFFIMMRDDIRGAGVVEVLLVDLSHQLIPDQVDAQLELLQVKFLLQQSSQEPAQMACVHRFYPLALMDQHLPAHASAFCPLPRWSS